MVAIEVVRIGWQNRNVSEPPVIDVAAIKVWRRWRDTEVRVRRITAGDTSSRAANLRLFRYGRWSPLFARGRPGPSSSNLVGVPAGIGLTGGPQPVAMRTSEACRLLDPLLVLHIRRKG
jgi:hypothetical protein